MDRLRPLPLPLFALLSVGLHVGTFRALARPGQPLPLAFEPSPAAQTMSGDTLELESAPPLPDEPDDPSGEAQVEPSLRGPGPRAAAPAGARAAPAPTGPSTPAAVFGAAGIRFATDLATTFTRAFPQAASADPAWEATAFGTASSADVTLVLDDEGHLSNSAMTGSPSNALRQGIQRTLALIGPRTFTAREAVTKLRVTARVTRGDIHDGLHGEVFALSGGSFFGNLGTAFFALPPASGPGRRVDVELRLIR